MGDIDSVTGVNLVKLDKRQLKIEKLKELQILRFFLFVSIAGRYGKKNVLIFSEYLTNCRFCKILTSQLENVTNKIKTFNLLTL